MSTNYWAVESKETKHYEGVFLGKLAGGWVPQLALHGHKYGCVCGCEESHYQTWEELMEFLDGRVVKSEFGDVYSAAGWVNKLERWREKNDRTPGSSRSWIIDGWHFVDGNWS